MAAFQDVIRLQIFGGVDNESSSSGEHFEIIRDLESGNPVGVITTSADFSPFRKDPSARLLEMDKASNFPIKISTASISAESISTMESKDDLTVVYKNAFPEDYTDMLDLSPS